MRRSSKSLIFIKILGGQGQNRTADTRIFSPLLYQLSYLAKISEAAYAKAIF